MPLGGASFHWTPHFSHLCSTPIALRPFYHHPDRDRSSSQRRAVAMTSAAPHRHFPTSAVQSASARSWRAFSRSHGLYVGQSRALHHQLAPFPFFCCVCVYCCVSRPIIYAIVDRLSKARCGRERARRATVLACASRCAWLCECSPYTYIKRYLSETSGAGCEHTSVHAGRVSPTPSARPAGLRSVWAPVREHRLTVH